VKVTAIIQARMGSSRLPGKVLLPLAGRPVLEHVVERVAAARRIEQLVVATSTAPGDDRIARFCAERNIACFRGSELDVLDRYYQAMCTWGADPVVRITADCPLVDPDILDAVVAGYQAGRFDLYGLAGDFPDGLDCVVFRRSALETAWREAELPSEREHVGPFIETRPERFAIGGYRPFVGLGHLRWTLDEPADYSFLRLVFDELQRPGHIFHAREVLDLLARRPDLADLNAGIPRNQGYQRSLAADAAWRARQGG